MNRTTPLRRNAPMVRKPARRRERDCEYDDYTAWLHTQPCDGLTSFPGHICDGPIQQAHLRDMTGLGRKELPTDSIPLCMALHDEYDGRRPAERFKGMDLDNKKTWMRGRIAVYQARYHANLAIF